ncbi:MAG: iron-containing alcohol dehydrogenase, partial [Betaproteobacteria bacterium]
DMLMASMMGAIAFQKDLGAVHSCAHALSTVADLHHGLANGIMLDHVLLFNAPVAIGKMAEMARVARVPGVHGAGDEAASAAFIVWIAQLKKLLGVPARLGEVGINATHIDALVEVAINDICHQTNPRSCTREDFARIFVEAI